MTLEEMRARVVDINKRKAELDNTIKTATDVKAIEDARSEEDKLIEERGQLNGQMLEITRNNAEAAIAAKESEQRKLPIPESRESGKPMSKREALSLSLGLTARKHTPTDEQKRALDATLTTTAVTFTPASTTVDGVNNGGLFIQTNQILDLLREDKALTPVLDAVLFSSLKGLTVYPYRAQRGTAQAKAEGKGVNQDAMEWKNLELKGGVLSIEIAVTDELEALVDFDFGAYLLDQIEQDLTEDWGDEIIHGDGSSGHIAGVIYGLTATKLTAGAEIDGCLKLLHSLKGKYRRNSAVYVAQDIYDKVVETKGTDGHFIFNVLNGGTGWNSLDGCPVKVDETLETGEVVVGNVAKFYKANMDSPLTIKGEYKAHEGITINVAKEFCHAAPFPGAFAYGKISA